MSTFTELVGSSALRETYGVSGIPPAMFKTIACALKHVLAADGAIHGAELNAYLEMCRRYGAPDNMLTELRDFDPSETSLDECLKDLDPDSFPARGLLYDTIRIAKADGDYADAEKAAVGHAAELLGIDDEWLVNITALADAEDALRALRVSMLMPPGLRPYS
jgi:uncharacterized tellurite resistance protein B-like protein